MPTGDAECYRDSVLWGDDERLRHCHPHRHGLSGHARLPPRALHPDFPFSGASVGLRKPTWCCRPGPFWSSAPKLACLVASRFLSNAGRAAVQHTAATTCHTKSSFRPFTNYGLGEPRGEHAAARRKQDHEAVPSALSNLTSGEGHDS